MGTFSAEVGKWAAKSEARMTAVFRDAAQTVAEEVKKPVAAGGRMRVRTGHLRRSLMASTSAMPRIDPNSTNPDDVTVPNDDSQINLVIAGADIGETLYLGFTAAYARPREYEDGFVRLTAQRWKPIVEESARRIKSRVDARG